MQRHLPESRCPDSRSMTSHEDNCYFKAAKNSALMGFFRMYRFFESILPFQALRASFPGGKPARGTISSFVTRMFRQSASNVPGSDKTPIRLRFAPAPSHPGKVGPCSMLFVFLILDLTVQCRRNHESSYPPFGHLPYLREGFHRAASLPCGKLGTGNFYVSHKKWPPYEFGPPPRVPFPESRSMQSLEDG